MSPSSRRRSGAHVSGALSRTEYTLIKKIRALKKYRRDFNTKTSDVEFLLFVRALGQAQEKRSIKREYVAQNAPPEARCYGLIEMQTKNCPRNYRRTAPSSCHLAQENQQVGTALLVQPSRFTSMNSKETRARTTLRFVLLDRSHEICPLIVTH